MKFPFRQELVILIFLFPNSIQTGRMMEKYPHAKESQHRVHAGAPWSTAAAWLLGVILFHWRRKASCLWVIARFFFCPFVSFGFYFNPQSASSEATCAPYLTVESEDPVTMTLSSYCRHNTEPVWPVNIFRHSRDCLSQIYEGKIDVGRAGGDRERWAEEDTEKGEK